MKKNSFYILYKSPLAIVGFLIIVAGFFAYSKMKVELLPNVTFPKIKVIADNGEQPVENMLIGVTQPLEEAIKTSENLNLLQSTTSRGSCEISAFFKWNTDINLAKQQIEAAIAQVRSELPVSLKVQIEKMNPSILPVAGYSLEGALSPMELKTLATYTVKPYLEQIQGIRQIAVTGGKNKEYRIVLNQDKLSQLRLTPNDINDVLSQANFIEAAGYASEHNRLYLIITDASIRNLEKLKNTVIRNSPQGRILLKDVAEIKIVGQLEYIKIKANGKDVPLVAVMKQPEANLSDINAELQQRISDLNTSILPQGVTLRPYYNQADFVGEAINSIRDVLWIGILLAIIITILFLKSYRSSLIILITVPVSLLLTIVMMFSLGYNFNIMTLGAIAAAIGLVIDDAVVVVEQIHRTHEEHPGSTYRELIPKAMKYLLPAMIGSSLSTLVIFLPFFIMTGVAGAYFQIMTNTMIVTLIASFFVSWIFLPVFYILFFGDKKEKKLKAATVHKKSWVLFFVKRPVISLFFILLMIGTMVVIFPKLPSGFLPEMDEGAIVLDFDSPPGTSLDVTEEMLVQVDKIVENTPEVESFSRRTGTQMGFFITEPSRGDYLIKLKTDRSLSTGQVIDKIRVQIEEKLPALTVDFGQVIGDMLGDLMSSTQPIEIKLFGNDEKQIQEYSAKIASLVESVQGTADVFDGIVIAGPSVTINPKFANLKEFGLSPADLQLQLKTRVGGVLVSSVQENLRFCDVRMVYPGYEKNGYDNIINSKVFLPDGVLVPLKRFADIQLTKGVAEINRENLKKVGYITARLNNRDLGSTLKDVQSKIKHSIQLPVGMNIEYGGAYKEQRQAFKELFLILVIAIFLVFVILLFLYRKLNIALLLSFLILLAPAGSAILLFLLHMPLNVGSYIGIIMIIGIVGEAAIFTYLQYTQERKKGENVQEAIVYSISIRLRPKLMTAISAIAALIPLALGIGSGAQMHQSLAIAVIGGLLIALPVLLIVLPSLLNIVEGNSKDALYPQKRNYDGE
ncbi:MAG: efflux RND transporter permease subunit [Prolixibacteraceae bacterium]|nr:efflux RND transporter permease subunit [Prolixibacteraceae bacterium]